MILVLKEHTDTLYCIFLISIILYVISNKYLIAQIASIMLVINIMACIFSNVEHEINKPLVIIIIIILTTIIYSPLIFIHQISQKLESVSYFQKIYENTMKEIITNNALAITPENIDKFKLENPLTQLIQTTLIFELMLLTSTITLILMNMNIMIILFIIFFILIIIVEIIQYKFDLYSSSEIDEMYIKNLNKTNIINKDTLRVIRIFQKHFLKTILIPLHTIILIIIILIFIIITYILPLSITRESTT